MYQQTQYQPLFAPPGQPQFVPQQNGGAPGASLQQQVAQGIFPYLNRVEVVGQVFGTGQNTGINWRPGQNGGEGHLEITLKLRKAWGGQNPGVKQSKVKLIAYGQLGQAIGNQIRPGMIVRAVGEIKVSNFQMKQGPKAGQWQTSVQIQLRGGQNSEVPFEVLGGPLPIVDEGQQQNNFGGGQQNNGYGGGQQNNGFGGQQNNGGFQQGGGPQGGFYQPQQGQFQPAQPQQQYQPQPQFQPPQGQQFQQGIPQFAPPPPAQPQQQYQPQQQFQPGQPVQGQMPQMNAPIPGQPQGTFAPPPPQGQQFPPQGGGQLPFPLPQH